MTRWLDFLSGFLVVYLALVAIPAKWIWYEPHVLTVGDGPGAIRFDRIIKRDFVGRYSGSIRDVTTSAIVCDFNGGPFTYRKDSALPERIDLEWWTGKEQCSDLDAGSYVLETCWAVVDPLWGMLPDKSVCLTSNVFKVWRAK